MGSSAYSYNASTSIDNRVANPGPGSIVSAGGGSSVYKEVIPEQSFRDLLSASSSQFAGAIGAVTKSQEGSAAALSKAFEQRAIETDTPQSTLSQVSPVLIIGLIVLALFVWRK